MVKHDLKYLFGKFHRGSLDVETLNHEIVSLISEVSDSDTEIHNYLC